MAEVLHREAQYDAMVADPDREAVATGADRPGGNEGLHRIVVVGGGAAGLELVTRLGDRLGQRRRASVTWWKVLEHISGSRCCTKWRRAASTLANTR